MTQNPISFTHAGQAFNYGWSVDDKFIIYDESSVENMLKNLSAPVFVTSDGARLGMCNQGLVQSESAGPKVVAFVPAMTIDRLGDSGFMQAYGAQYNYYAGAMANGIASVKMVAALGKAGFMGSFGAGGLVPERVEEAILAIKQALPHGPYLFNLIHSPNEPALEQAGVDLYLKHGVRAIEAAAYMRLTPYVVQYRAAGLFLDPQNRIIIKNKIVAKVSRREVAAKFLEPAPERILSSLVQSGQITQAQADLAKQVPMADDITVEADSGGHTDNRALVTVLPSIIALRDEICKNRGYQVRVGAGGGIGTPEAALAAFVMGAAFVVTGSVNQACVESGASNHSKKLLAQADMADVIMAPAADMFEMGVKVQVLKRGTLFAMRAAKLYDFYCNYPSIDDILPDEKQKLETQVFQKKLDQVWQDTVEFFSRRDPALIEKAKASPKKKMALIFRWYLGLSSRWANSGEPGREMDYQIWCGSCMGAFNAWVKGTCLEEPENRKVALAATNIMQGAAYLHRLNILKTLGVGFCPGLATYRPVPGNT